MTINRCYSLAAKRHREPLWPPRDRQTIGRQDSKSNALKVGGDDGRNHCLAEILSARMDLVTARFLYSSCQAE